MLTRTDNGWRIEGEFTREQLLELRRQIDAVTSDSSEADKVLQLMNSLSGRRFSSGKDKILRILKDFTLTQVEGVVYHKAHTWLPDPKMNMYFRPATIFKSKPAFEAYVDDSVNYWMEHAGTK